MPERTCVGCRAKRSADQMVRICATGDGRLEASPVSNGRGAWICRSSECFRAASAKGRVERALRVTLPEDAQKQLSSICKVLGF